MQLSVMVFYVLKHNKSQIKVTSTGAITSGTSKAMSTSSTSIAREGSSEGKLSMMKFAMEHFRQGQERL